MKVTAFSGGFGYPSTTTQLLELIVTELSKRFPTTATTIELRDVANDLADATLLGFASDNLQEAMAQVEQADILIAGSAVFRGGYAGLFKAFFDLVDPVAMRGKPVILAASGQSPRHQLVLDTHLRPLFSYFGSFTLPTSVYASKEEWEVGGRPTAALHERITRIGHEVEGYFERSPSSTVG